MEPKEIKYIDLFCGLGAFHTAFDRNSNKDVKYKCVLACDIDEDVRTIYEQNYGLKPVGDIRNIKELPDFDILCAGFPCQPFSIAGKQEGFNDKEKGNLFYEILRLIDMKKPEFLFLENVKNLFTIHNGNTFNTIKTELIKRGYNVSHKVIDSRYYNSPQSRKRIYIVCNKKEQPYKFNEVNNAIVPVSSIIDYKNKNWFDYNEKYKLEKATGKSTMKYKLINKLTGLGGRQGERVYGISSYGATICATSGGPGKKTGLYEIEPNKIRTLSVKETLQMFGFPITFIYSVPNTKMLFHLGNSIVVNVIEHLIKSL